MKIINTLLLALLAIPASTLAEECPPFEATPEWLAKIESLAPEKPLVAPKQKRTALVFSRMTGFKHWCTPHTAAVVKILGEKSGAFDVVLSDDISHFEPENIGKFDLIILNNTCSDRSKRNLFYDVLQDMDKAQALEDSLISYIASGHGLVGLHGAIVFLNNSDAFSSVFGGSFERHPRQQTVIGKLVDPDHPILTAFQGKPLVHFDEPYFFNRAYTSYNFRPLLEMELTSSDADPQGPKRYISWIKKHGEGHVFYCSPSHNAQSFEQPELLQFMLNGIQYAAGDLDCVDTPIRKEQ